MVHSSKRKKKTYFWISTRDRSWTFYMFSTQMTVPPGTQCQSPDCPRSPRSWAGFLCSADTTLQQDKETTHLYLIVHFALCPALNPSTSSALPSPRTWSGKGTSWRKDSKELSSAVSVLQSYHWDQTVLISFISRVSALPSNYTSQTSRGCKGAKVHHQDKPALPPGPVPFLGNPDCSDFYPLAGAAGQELLD